MDYAGSLRVLLTIIVACLGWPAAAQVYCPSNINFELGSLSNWVFDTARNLGAGGITTPVTVSPLANRHVLTSGTATDYYGGFPIVDPIGGNYSLKLGNDMVNAQVDRVRYTFTIPTNVNNYSLVYRYAVVFENPSHTAVDQPFFRVRVYNAATSALINCASFTYVAQSSLPGFSTSTKKGVYGNAVVYYKPWATASLNLTGQAGNMLTVEFTSADCALGAHMGYGYVDMGCGLFAISSSTCKATSPLSAPPGFQKYTWYNSSYTVTIDTGQNITIPTPAVLTQYHVVLTPYPGYGCQDTLTATLVGSSLAVNAGPDTMLCNNQSISLNPAVTGNAPPYTYSWAPASGLSCTACISPTASPVVHSRYVLQVTDSFGCVKKDTVNVKARPDVVATRTNATCFGTASGNATAVTSMGTPPYTYSWNTTPVQTAAMATTLFAGSYTVTATDARGCLDTQTVTISAPAPLVAAITSVDSVKCYGGNSGRANAAASGGTAPYAYSWNSTPVQTIATATSLIAGLKIVTVTDANGCTDTEAAIIPQPLPMLPAVSLTPVLCNGNSSGSASVTAAGGTAPYTYAVNTGAFSASNSFAGLAAGAYIIHLKDAYNCTKDTSILITEPPPLVVGNARLQPLCYDSSNGAVTLTGIGGTPPYSYAVGTGSYSSNTVYNGLKAGSYVLHLKDANGCVKDSVIGLGQPQPISAIVTVGNVLCNGSSSGTVSISPTGGTPAFTYAINAGSFGTGNTFSGMAAGAHVIHLKDANGCTKDSSISILQPPSLSLAYSAIQPLCYGASNGSVTISGTGGSLPYQYALNTGPFAVSGAFAGLTAGSYTLHIKDANNCIADSIITLSQPPLLAATTTKTNVSCFGGSNGTAQAVITGGTAPYTYAWTGTTQTTANVTGLSAGSYTVTVADNKGCTSQATVSISHPAAISTTFSVGSPVCFNTPTGSATVVASGGTSPYSYSWTTSPVQTGATATLLSTGSYTVTVTDAAGCTGTGSTTVPQTLPITVTVTTVSINCFGGKDGMAIATSAGGTGPYTYVWSTTPAQTGDTIRSLSIGSYTVTATSAAGCKGTGTGTVTQPTILAAATVARPTCPGLMQGRIVASVSGGTGPYSYEWRTTPIQRVATAVGLGVGSYQVIVADDRGCKDTAQDIVTAFDAPQVDAGPDQELCVGSGLSLQATGATYEWSPAATLSCAACASPIASPLSNTMYKVSGTDTNGCQATDSVVVTVIQHVPLSVDPKRIICEGDSVRLGADGGTSLFWLPAALIRDKDTSRPMVRPAVTTVFHAVITENRCFRDTLTQEVEVLPTPTVDLGPDLEAPVGTLLQLNAKVTGASKISWTPKDGLSCTDCFSPQFKVRGKVTYIVEVQNMLGCPATDTVSIRDVCDEHYFFFPNVFTPNGDGQNDRFYPQGIGSLLVAHFMIYDRWGETVFSASNIYVNDAAAGWDGTFRNLALKPDVYVYVMDAVCEDGKKVVIRGDISLIR